MGRIVGWTACQRRCPREAEIQGGGTGAVAIAAGVPCPAAGRGL